MKRIGVFIVIILCLSSCEDTVEVDLNTEEPRLVIEATGIQKERESIGQFQVKLTETAPYFQDSIPVISNAKITLEINGKTIEIPESAANPGVYQRSVPMINDEDYKLTIEVKDEIYQGITQLHKTTPIDAISQEKGIFNPDDVLLKIFYTDPPDESNFYLFTFISKHGKELIYSDDTYYDGHRASMLYNEEFIAGDSITVRIHGTGKGFNRYISILLDQSNPTNNPFATPPGTVRGNMINVEDSEKFPLGYFRISQEYEKKYIIE